MFWKAQGVGVAAVEQLLLHMGGRQEEMQAKPLTRYRMLNLLVPVQEGQVAEQAVQAVAALSQQHPSRSIVLIAAPQEAGAGVDARILVHAEERGEDQPRVAFCEQVVLTVRGEAAGYLSSVAIPLLVPELPTVLWWPQEPPWGRRVFQDLLGTCDRLVVDSGVFAAPGALAELWTAVRGLDVGASHGRRFLRVGDLAWVRLAPWRERLAGCFDGATARGELQQLERVVIRRGTMSEPEALLLAGWLASRLSWRLREAGTAAGGLSAVWEREGGGVTLEVCAAEGEDSVELSNPRAVFRIQRTGQNGAVFTRFPGEPGVERQGVWEDPTSETCLDRVLGARASGGYQAALVQAAKLAG